MNLPTEANVALVDLMSAIGRYSELMDAAARINLEEDHPTFDRIQATVLDAEQALVKIFTAVLGEPDVTYPEDAE